jgi:hypothetical protein
MTAGIEAGEAYSLATIVAFLAATFALVWRYGR